MSTGMHGTEVGSPRTDALPLLDSDHGTGTLGVPAAVDVKLSPSMPTATRPTDAADVDPAPAPTNAPMLSGHAITSQAASLPDDPSADYRPVLISPVPGPTPSADVPRSVVADSPAPSGSPCSERDGQPVGGAVSPVRSPSPSHAQIPSVRRLLSIGVQTVVILTKRGEHVAGISLSCNLRLYSYAIS